MTISVQRPLFYGTGGIRSAPIILVGESWGSEEKARQEAFVGQSGMELRRMLTEARISPGDCFFTNLCAEQPPGNELEAFCIPTRDAKSVRRTDFRGLYPNDFFLSEIQRLYRQLDSLSPKVIVAVGNWALWALSSMGGIGNVEGKRVPTGIQTFRGSMGYTNFSGRVLPCLPIIHPAAILREWYWRAPTKHDLSRSRRAIENDWRPNVPPVVLAPPTFQQATSQLSAWLYAASRKRLRLVCDIETARRSFITCVGFASSERFAMTVPFVQLREGGGLDPYWSFEEELKLWTLIKEILLHPNIEIEGQNFIYDMQFLRLQLGITPRLSFDTMLAHHLLFPGTPQALDYLSSLYVKYHWFWKDDNKDWEMKGDIFQHFRYNAEDCLRQYEVGTELRRLLKESGLSHLWEERLKVNALAFRMMNRGVRIDTVHRAKLAEQLSTAAEQFDIWFEKILPQARVLPKAKTPWWRSPQQQKEYFGKVLGLDLPKHKKTKQPTLGKEGLSVLLPKYPEYSRLFSALKDYRSLKVFFNTFVLAPLDSDQRMRCSYKVSGTETFRWSSSENAFGSGTNLQNLPQGNEE